MESPTLQKRWLTVREAQDYAGIGKTKQYELLQEGEISASHAGRSIRIDRLSLDAYLERHPYTR